MKIVSPIIEQYVLKKRFFFREKQIKFFLFFSKGEV